MFDAFKTAPRHVPKPVVIELRDGRRLRGTLQLPVQETAETLLRKAMPFLTIRTQKGDIAINRDNIAALLLGEEAKAPEAPKTRVRPKVKAQPATHQEHGFDPCRILNVRPGATRHEIKTAWRKRIAECHPDSVRSRGGSDDVVAAAQRQAALVNSAYQALIGVKRGAA